MPPPFDYDAAKSAANLAKHGIDCEGAKALWDDVWLLEAPAKTKDEPRWLAVGAWRANAGRPFLRAETAPSG